ncbi:negative regulator of RNA polymerase III transcription [Malassezia pachydermatis]
MSECKVFTRIEAYSCKAVNKEKRLFKSLESSYLLSASTSPPAYLAEALASPFGRLDQPSARKTLFLLIATLNGAFPDHDFSEVNPTDFVRESDATEVLNSITTTLLSLRGSSGSPGSLGKSLDESPMLGSFARSPMAHEARSSASTSTPSGGASASRSASASLPVVVDEIIQTADCEVYTFHPDMDSDPHASVEPDEEGGDMDEGDPYDEGYTADDDHGVVSRGGTPAMDVDDVGMDTPAFDEEMDGGGFSTHTSSAPGHAAGLSGSSGAGASESPTLPLVGEDDLAGAGAGLLWSTFAFFYNRRMKRILFVSVWCRKNAQVGAPPVVWHSPALVPTRPAITEDVPVLGLTSTLYQRLADRPGEHRLTPDTSPARPARARRSAPYSLRRQGRPRGRSASNSPAPSALAPFPHAQSSQRVPAGSEMPRRGRPTPTSHPSLDASLHSTSAPAPSAYRPLHALGTAGSPPPVRRATEARPRAPM